MAEEPTESMWRQNIARWEAQVENVKQEYRRPLWNATPSLMSESSTVSSRTIGIDSNASNNDPEGFDQLLDNVATEIATLEFFHFYSSGGIKIIRVIERRKREAENLEVGFCENRLKKQRAVWAQHWRKYCQIWGTGHEEDTDMFADFMAEFVKQDYETAVQKARDAGVWVDNEETADGGGMGDEVSGSDNRADGGDSMGD